MTSFAPSHHVVIEQRPIDEAVPSEGGSDDDELGGEDPEVNEVRKFC